MIKIKRILKEQTIPAPATSAPATTTEKDVDDTSNTSMLKKFAQLSNTSQTTTALTADFKSLSGDQKYDSLAQFLTSIGIDKATVQSTLGKMK